MTGAVVAKLSQQAALTTTGTLADKVKQPNTRARPFEDVVNKLQQAAVPVLVY